MTADYAGGFDSIAAALRHAAENLRELGAADLAQDVSDVAHRVDVRARAEDDTTQIRVPTKESDR